MAEAADKEAAVRAAFLYRLAFFVDWSPLLASPDQPLRFCLLEADAQPVALPLREHTRSRKVGSHPVEVAELGAGDPLDGCHLVYLAARRELDAAQARMRLVVADDAAMLDHGAHLALVAETEASGERRLAFLSRHDRIRACDLDLNARLLQLVRLEGKEPRP